ncbi:MAG: peroxiredoxin [Proteobacteria bacterium]|nr:peroxiredoxin [Pseudomonadota bacterium]HQR03261.1 peroxiredoxin [Rhodocyclaceae bacterium]
MLDTPIPEFTASATGGQSIVSSALEGRKLVLYFYPKDSTPGCTTEAQQFRDLHGDFVKAGAMVLGVSRDSLKSHENFKAKLGLPFDLVSDPDETLCTLFGVMKLKNMYGKQVRGIERSTFVIDAKGILRHEWRGLKADGHAAAVLAVVRAL